MSKGAMPKSSLWFLLWFPVAWTHPKQALLVSQRWNFHKFSTGPKGFNLPNKGVDGIAGMAWIHQWRWWTTLKTRVGHKEINQIIEEAWTQSLVVWAYPSPETGRQTFMLNESPSKNLDIPRLHGGTAMEGRFRHCVDLWGFFLGGGFVGS